MEKRGMERLTIARKFIVILTDKEEGIGAERSRPEWSGKAHNSTENK